MGSDGASRPERRGRHGRVSLRALQRVTGLANPDQATPEALQAILANADPESPAVFEELAFRGLLQARLIPLFGRTQGIILGGIAFALAHGITVGLPFHAFLGFYLGWLRERSRSLIPGMIVHFVYNGTLVWYYS